MHEPVTDDDIRQALRGAPDWITPKLMRETLDVFQPRYKERLTAHDALEMLINVGQLYEVLFKSPVRVEAER